ncbi:thioesterase II family protein [Streptomyces sp. NPDC002851]
MYGSTPDDLRLFVFHHAGGSHLLYREWPGLLPATWDVRLIDAPGRGRLSDEPPIDNAHRLTQFFLDRLGPELTGPFAFFGHSMGGLIAYQLALELAAQGRELPLWLGMSARSAPGEQDEGDRRHELPDAELRDHLAAMGGTPREILDDPDLWAMFAPAIRNDLKVVDTWHPAPDAPRLTMPVAAYGGRTDVVVAPRRIADWAGHCERFQGLRLFDGGHFYFQDDPRPLLDLVVRDARAARRAVPVPARSS